MQIGNKLYTLQLSDWYWFLVIIRLIWSTLSFFWVIIFICFHIDVAFDKAIIWCLFSFTLFIWLDFASFDWDTMLIKTKSSLHPKIIEFFYFPVIVPRTLLQWIHMIMLQNNIKEGCRSTHLKYINFNDAICQVCQF